MNQVGVLLFDVGGVLGTNGWDRVHRRVVCERFGLDWEEFTDRHELVVAAFEEGGLTIDEYLDRTIFYRERGFARHEFVAAMLAGSRADAEMLRFATDLAATGHYTMATLNNESRELNEHRIGLFGLRDLFPFFLTSCYLGMRKPNPEMYELAIDVTQRRADECVFIDDRPVNVECAERVGMTAITFVGIDSLREELAAVGVTPGASNDGRS